MIIYHNNIKKNIERGTLLTAFLQQLQQQANNYAVAINESFVPRSHYAELELKEGDHVEILVPMQGG